MLRLGLDPPQFNYFVCNRLRTSEFDLCSCRAYWCNFLTIFARTANDTETTGWPRPIENTKNYRTRRKHLKTPKGLSVEYLSHHMWVGPGPLLGYVMYVVPTFMCWLGLTWASASWGRKASACTHQLSTSI